MGKRKLYKKHKLFVLSACCFIFIFSVIGVFNLFQHRLDEDFHTVLIDELKENTQGQKQRAESMVSNLQEFLDILQGTLDPSKFSGPSGEFELMLQDDRIQIDYLEAQQILDQSASPELPENAKAVCHQLLAGEETITDLGEFWFADDASLFALLRPVFYDGQLAGVLRAQIDASLLAGENMDSISFFQKVYVILTRPDGSVLYADTPYPDSRNLFSSVLEGDISSDEVEHLRQAFEENPSDTLCFNGKGNSYYMSWESLDFNDWRIVRFARSPDIVLKTATILRRMILTGICLIVLTAIFCIVLLHLMLRQKRHLEAQRRRYDALAQFNDTLLFEYDILPNRVTFTPNALERLDLNAECLEGISGEYYMTHLIHPDDQQGIREVFQLSNILLGETYYLEARFRCKGGSYSWFGCQFKSIESQGDCTSRIVGKLVDISDQRGREQLLRQAALADALTGVYNRSAETIINNLLEKDPRGLFFMIDLDDFKNVNDTYGHAAGDALLISVAQILREVFRPDDIIARVGGDEFVAFLSGANDPEVAMYKAATIQNRMEQLYIPGTNQPISASIGASKAPINGTTYDALTRAADQAMYTIKQQSKKGFAFHKHED